MAAPGTATRVVVGIDGSSLADAAVVWAAEEAARRGVGLHLLHVFIYVDILGGYEVLDADEPQNLGGWVCEQAEQKVHALFPDLPTTCEVRVGRPARELVAASDDAALVVLGARGHGRITGRLIGSVSQQVAAHARCPVVVVRGEPTAADRPVVVGVDGSAESLEALELAVAHASRRGASVRAVRAEYVERPIGVPPGGGTWYTDLVEAARQETEEVRRAVEAVAGTGVDIELSVVREHPVTALSHQATEASLLVVASRGLGGFGGLLLGSVSQGVLSHARCPVAVVHGRRAPAATR